jgi:hypothetical protein
VLVAGGGAGACFLLWQAVRHIAPQAKPSPKNQTVVRRK